MGKKAFALPRGRGLTNKGPTDGSLEGKVVTQSASTLLSQARVNSQESFLALDNGDLWPLETKATREEKEKFSSVYAVTKVVFRPRYAPQRNCEYHSSIFGMKAHANAKQLGIKC